MQFLGKFLRFVGTTFLALLIFAPANAAISCAVGTTIKAYTQLEYIQSSGKQYIDTGISSDGTMDMEASMEFVSVPSDATLVGSRSSQTRYYLAHYFKGWAVGYGSLYNNTSIMFMMIV